MQKMAALRAQFFAIREKPIGGSQQPPPPSGRGLKKRRHAFPTRNGKIWKFDFFYLEDIDLRSPKSHTIEIFSQDTSHKKMVILAFIGAELAGGGAFLPPPLPGRVILNPIRGRGLRAAVDTKRTLRSR